MKEEDGFIRTLAEIENFIKKFQVDEKYFKIEFNVYSKYFDEMNRECFRPCKNISLGVPVLHIKYVFYIVLSCCQDKWALLVTCLHISLTKSFCFVLFSCVD